jgi:hypothetical protein
MTVSLTETSLSKVAHYRRRHVYIVAGNDRGEHKRELRRVLSARKCGRNYQIEVGGIPWVLCVDRKHVAYVETKP